MCYLPHNIIIVPVTYAWRDELEKKTQNALHRALGNIPPASRGGMMSRSSQRGPSQFDGLEDGKVNNITIHIMIMISMPFMADSGSTLSHSPNRIYSCMSSLALQCI